MTHGWEKKTKQESALKPLPNSVPDFPSCPQRFKISDEERFIQILSAQKKYKGNKESKTLSQNEKVEAQWRDLNLNLIAINLTSRALLKNFFFQKSKKLYKTKWCTGVQNCAIFSAVAVQS